MVSSRAYFRPATRPPRFTLDALDDPAERADTADMDPDDLDYWGDHPNPADDEIRDLCEAWLTYERDDHNGGVDEEDPNWWAVDAVLDAQNEPEPDLLWSLILRLCELAEPDDPAVVMIGCGPLESLIFDFGERAIDLIEPAADENATLFRGTHLGLGTLTSVWVYSEPVGPRVERYLASRADRPGPS
jgi:hypothetical protein